MRFIFRGTAEDIDFADRIYAYMEINDTEKLNGVLDRFMESMLTADNTPEKAKISCITMLMDVRSQMSRSAADKKPENMISDDFVNEISDMHSNINYFHNKFKKYVGMSPLSYKKQFGGGKDE